MDKVQATFDFIDAEPTKPSLLRFAKMLRKLYERVAKAINTLESVDNTWTGANDFTNSVFTLPGGVVVSHTPPFAGQVLTATSSTGADWESGIVNLTHAFVHNQTAAISATTLYTTSVIGLFRVSALLVVNRADAVSSTLGPVTISYQGYSPTGAQNSVMLMGDENGLATTTNSGNTVSAKLSGTLLIDSLGGSSQIQYSVGYASNTPGSMRYDVYLNLERLNSIV